MDVDIYIYTYKYIYIYRERDTHICVYIYIYVKNCLSIFVLRLLTRKAEDGAPAVFYRGMNLEVCYNISIYI